MHLCSQIRGLSVVIDEDHFLLLEVSRSRVFLQLLIFLGANPVWSLCFVVRISAVVLAQNEPQVRRHFKVLTALTRLLLSSSQLVSSLFGPL